MSKSDLGPRRITSAVWRYGLSVLSVGIFIAVTIPLRGFGVRTSLFFPAFLLSTCFCGLPAEQSVGGRGPWSSGLFAFDFIHQFLLHRAAAPISIRRSGHSAHR